MRASARAYLLPLGLLSILLLIFYHLSANFFQLDLGIDQRVRPWLDRIPSWSTAQRQELEKELFGQGTTPAGEEEKADVSDGSPTEHVVEAPAKVEMQPLPRCERTMMIHLRGTRGFASEFNRFLKMAAIGEHFGYTVFLGSEHDWMYGRYNDYFTPPTLPCSLEGTPGDDSRERPEMFEDHKSLEKPAWTKHDHIQGPRSTSTAYSDDLFLSFATNNASLLTLHTTEIDAFPPSLPLTGSQTVPPPMYDAFEILSQQVKKWWNPNPDVRAMVDAMKRGMRWNGPEKPTIVGLHIRLGDKCSETVNPKYSPLRFASTQIRRKKTPHSSKVCQDLASSGGLDADHAQIYLSGAESAFKAIAKSVKSDKVKRRAVLAIMSDDTKALDKLERGEGEPSGFVPLLLPEMAKRIPGAEGVTVKSKLDKGFSIGGFQALSEEGRVAVTRQFIRDVTLLGESSDAFVFTGSSNVGRLAVLLAGSEKAKQGRFISCDSRWFPTAYYN